MSFHFKQLGYLKSLISQYTINKGENTEKILENLDNTTYFNTQQEFLNIIVHACDISNPTKPFNIYTKWVDRVMEEFWAQGDKERELNLPISFLCDRHTTTKPNAQLGFMDNIVFPFFNTFVDFFPQLYFLIENVEENKSQYKKLKEEDEKKKQM
jgi:hypothetical protein